MALLIFSQIDSSSFYLKTSENTEVHSLRCVPLIALSKKKLGKKLKKTDQCKHNQRVPHKYFHNSKLECMLTHSIKWI